MCWNKYHQKLSQAKMLQENFCCGEVGENETSQKLQGHKTESKAKSTTLRWLRKHVRTLKVKVMGFLPRKTAF